MNPQPSFYFYDLETSGINSKTARIMQFAGQRTDKQLVPIGQPHNFLIKLTEEIVPEPEALLITGITPQTTLEDGYTEKQFCDIFSKEIAAPGTTFVGFNSVRFDDEFMRYLLFRNFHDPYEWTWKDGRSRWDMLDVVRMTRALRPKGIEWPFASDGSPSNRLEFLTKVNHIDHFDAHDALSDVQATIAVAKLIKHSQPKLFSYLESMRTKQQVKQFIERNSMFVYTSGKYQSEFQKTTIVFSLGICSDNNGVFVFDLRVDPSSLLALTVPELAKKWQETTKTRDEYFPVKRLQFNRCPAIAPISVINETTTKNIAIDMKQVTKHEGIVRANLDALYRLITGAAHLLDNERQLSISEALFLPPETKLYDGFLSDSDKFMSKEVVSLTKDTVKDYLPSFQDTRLNDLFPLYKARNFRSSLSETETETWNQYVTERLGVTTPDGLIWKTLKKIETLKLDRQLSTKDQYVLDELTLYLQRFL